MWANYSDNKTKDIADYNDGGQQSLYLYNPNEWRQYYNPWLVDYAIGGLSIEMMVRDYNIYSLKLDEAIPECPI